MGVVDQLKNLTKELEGPTALRVVSAGCGISLMVCSVMSLFPITDAILDFNTLFLKVHAG
ncbi:MAG: uncharacterized protein KVP18_003892 [Porospora cf. gigantea A]|uniref:uncharacterized protein n=1 Tax=Porospora cf. gigantea A TaxID=2853593 RepID=UPI00355A1534|nr:MAG: hypothetical protein KVP18_003892 [Porospora cf. gigantea A]